MDANQFYWHLGNRIVHSLLILGLWKEFGEKRHCTHLIPTPPLGGRAVIRFDRAALHAADAELQGLNAPRSLTQVAMSARFQCCCLGKPAHARIRSPGATPPRFGLSDLTHGRGPYGAGMIRMSACLDYLTVGAPSAMVSAVL